MTWPRSHLLGVLLAEESVEALVVLAGSSRDPDLAPFVGGARLGQACVVAHGGGVWLVYFTSMEREEAARAEAGGVELVHPADFGMETLRRDGKTHEEILAAAVQTALDRAGVVPGRVALAGRPAAGIAVATARTLEEGGWKPVSGRGLMLALRRTKTTAEVEGVASAAQATVDAFRSVAEALAESAVRERGELWLDEERVTVARVKALAAQVFAAHGLEQPESSIVGPAEEGATGHSTGTLERVLRVGESIVVDLFPRGRLFADCTRTFCVGEPPEGLARAHGLVLEALETSLKAVRPGVRGWTLHERVCRLFENEGFAVPDKNPGTQRGYFHLLGHGVGYELHELPSFRKTGPGTDEFVAGDVVTIEPGLYDPDAGWGVRLEDLVVVTEDGMTNLTPLPYDLDPRSW
ncbi:MAG: aminopeptidase P family protein [Holophagales bacterium]|nr:aminopeptidase P family protein [Holophagales bacterium]MYG30616.1 aminopeptidase P family protein [Holophagales bacterium]MYI79137.1 aminopeptidase P family protein [Holophagales bacterium]